MPVEATQASAHRWNCDASGATERRDRQSRRSGCARAPQPAPRPSSAWSAISSTPRLRVRPDNARSEELVAAMNAAFCCATRSVAPTARHADYTGS